MSKLKNDLDNNLITEFFNMFYSNTISLTIQNGEGVRCTLFISGCSRCCHECFSSLDLGLQVWERIQEFEDQLLKDLANPYVKGLSLLGGNQQNVRTFSKLSSCANVLNLNFRKISGAGQAINLKT